MTENELATMIVDTAFHIHARVGPGLLESAYQAILVYELKKRGLNIESEVPVPVVYEGIKIEVGFRADMIVENKVIVELKSIEKIAPVHYKQVLTYLRMTDKRLGLLINFGESLIKNGIHRVANNLEEGTSSTSVLRRTV